LTDQTKRLRSGSNPLEAPASPLPVYTPSDKEIDEIDEIADAAARSGI
jgi:hypothetical protein